MDDARFVGCTQHDRACAVTEQNAGRAVVPIDDAAERFRADDQSLFRHAAFNVGVGSGQGVHKARADRLYVKCGAAVCYAELLLDDGRGGRELHIGGGGCHDNQIDFIGSDTGSNQSAARCFGGEVAGFFAFVCNMAELDAGTGGNPLVGRIDFFSPNRRC